MRKRIILTGMLGMLIAGMTGCGISGDTVGNEVQNEKNIESNAETSGNTDDSDEVITKEIDEDDPSAQTVIGSDTIDLGE